MYFLPILSLLGYCVAIRHLMRWSVEVIPFFVITLIVSLLYISGLFDVLQYGAEVLVLFGLALLALAPWYVKSDDWVTRHITPGFLFLVLFCIFFGFFAAHSHLHLWGEFAQWGARAKLVAFEHNLYSQSAVLMHPDYPPGAALFYYWFFTFSHYSEGVAHMAQQLLILLPLGVLVKSYTWERWQRAFLALSFAVLILLLLHVRMASNINLYVDSVIGVYWGMMLVDYYYSKRRIADILFLLPIVSFFVILKPGMLSFLVFLSIILIVDQSMQREGNVIKRIAAVISILGAGLLSHWLWHFFLYIHYSAIFPYLQALPSLTLTAKQVTVVGYFFWEVVKSLPTTLAILLLVVATVMLTQRKQKRTEIILLHSLMLLGFILYVFALLGIYLYISGADTVSDFASLDRYLKIYSVAWGLLAYGTLLPEWRASQVGQQKYFSGVLVACALIAFPTYLFYSHYRHVKDDHQRYSLLRLRRSLHPVVVAAKHMIPENSRVFVVWQNSSGFERIVLGYSLIPRYINPQPSSFGKPYAPNDVWTKNISRWRLKRMMQPYGYILLAYTDKPFWRTYGSLFKRRRRHELVEYLVCKRVGFDGFGRPGCWTQAVTAYLYKNR